jgi:hypothetical protein
LRTNELIINYLPKKIPRLGIKFIKIITFQENFVVVRRSDVCNMLPCKWRKHWSIDSFIANTLSANNKLNNKDPFFLLWRKSQISKKNMDFQRVEVISMAVALVAIVGGTAYYYYLTKKPKGSIFVFYLLFFIFVFVRAVFFLIYL